jgi:hypothetical protein
LWLELIGFGAAWLAHAAWYAGRAKRSHLLGRGRRSRWLPWLAAPLVLVTLASWAGAHGALLGACFGVLSLTSAASFNAILAPYSPRAFLVASALATVILVVGLAGWAHGA